MTRRLLSARPYLFVAERFKRPFDLLEVHQKGSHGSRKFLRVRLHPVP